MHHQCLRRISRAGRSEPATRRCQRRNTFLIEQNRNQQDSCDGERESDLCFCSCSSFLFSHGSTAFRCSLTTFMFSVHIFLLGISRNRHGGKSAFNNRNASQSRRRARFRTTARLSKRLLQMIPQRTPSSQDAGTAKKVKSGSFHFSPEAFTSSNSLFLLSLSALPVPDREGVRNSRTDASTGNGHAGSASQASESKSLASFLSAAGEHLAAFFGCHSCTETKLAVSAQYGRLIRSLHSFLPFHCWYTAGPRTAVLSLYELVSILHRLFRDGLNKIAHFHDSSSAGAIFFRIFILLRLQQKKSGVIYSSMES